MEVASSGSSTAVSGDIARHAVIWGKPSLMKYMHIYMCRRRTRVVVNSARFVQRRYSVRYPRVVKTGLCMDTGCERLVVNAMTNLT